MYCIFPWKILQEEREKKFISLVLLFSIPNAATATSVHFEITINFFQKRKKKKQIFLISPEKKNTRFCVYRQKIERLMSIKYSNSYIWNANFANLIYTQPLNDHKNMSIKYTRIQHILNYKFPITSIYTGIWKGTKSLTLKFFTLSRIKFIHFSRLPSNIFLNGKFE